jgi:hypothetical protein
VISDYKVPLEILEQLEQQDQSALQVLKEQAVLLVLQGLRVQQDY